MEPSANLMGLCGKWMTIGHTRPTEKLTKWVSMGESSAITLSAWQIAAVAIFEAEMPAVRCRIAGWLRAEYL